MPREAEWHLEPCATDMENAFYIFAVCVVVVGLDWALYSGTYKSIRVFFRIPASVNYKYFFFPRIIFVVLSGVIIAISALDPTNVPMVLVGFGLFLMTSLYPQVQTLVRSKLYKDDDDE